MRRIISAREQVEMLSPWLREAMPWYHVSPHDFPNGTDLRPGGDSPWDETDYAQYLPHDTADHVWLSPDTKNAHEWRETMGMDSGISPLHVYEVEPHGEPRPYDDEEEDPNESGYVAPGARVVRKHATPWHSKPGDPTYRVPTQDLQRHRQFNPSIETPEQMHRSLWTKSWDKDTPEYRNFRNDNFSSGGSSEGSTEEGLVEGFESGAKFPPTEITTNGVGAMLTDGNHRVNVADMMSHPDLESYIHYDPHAYGDDSYPSPVDPESELGKHIHKLVQNHPYEPVEGGPTTDHVFRRHPQTGEWQRGLVDHSAQPYFVDTPQDLQRMKRKVPGFKDQGLGNYFDVDFGNGPEITHERHLHANIGKQLVGWRLASDYRDFYHHTSPENADAIRANGFKPGLEKGSRPDALFFTNHPDSEYAQGFGSGQVHVKIPSHMFNDEYPSEFGEFDEKAGQAQGWLDDEFPSGEQHWAIPHKHLQREWIQP